MATPYVKQTWIDGDNTKPVSAARMGVIETGVFDAHYRPSVAVYASAAISIANNTSTAALFNTELYDTDAMHSTVSNTSRLTAPVAGKYAITATYGFASNATGLRDIQIRLNGTTAIDEDLRIAISGSGTILHVARDYLLAAADFVELIVLQQSGGALNSLSGIANNSFSMHLASY